MKKAFFMRLASLVCFATCICFASGSVLGAVTESNYYRHLKNIYEQKNPKLNDYLIEECKKFLSLYGKGSRANEVRYVMGLLYKEKKMNSMAIAQFLKGLFLDPNGDRMNDQREKINEIIAKDRHFKKLSSNINRITEGPFVEKPMSDKHYDYLRAIYDVDDKKLYQFMLEESKTFIVKYPKSTHVEDVQSWVARLYKMAKRYDEAIAAYQKTEALFPESLNVPLNRLTIAKLRYMELKDYQGAREDFSYIAETYAGKEVAGESYFYLGELNHKKFKNLSEAIEKYETVASNYPTNQFAVESLFRVADIYLKDLNDNENAILALTKIGKDFSGDERAPDSYDKIAEIYLKRVKDYDSAIATYKKLAQSYPESSIAPSRLYKSAGVSEKKLKDYGNAINLYENVRSMFPESKYAEKAKKRITSLRKKIRQY